MLGSWTAMATQNVMQLFSREISEVAHDNKMIGEGERNKERELEGDRRLRRAIWQRKALSGTERSRERWKIDEREKGMDEERGKERMQLSKI
jgi:hypothetical protein